MNAVIHLPRSERVYELALEGLTRVNEYLYRNGSLPSIYSPAAQVRYRREPEEVWRHAGDVIGGKWGDCEDLATARAGELRARGESRAKVIVRRTGPRMTHALVQRANGKIEDPSKRLGMSLPKGDTVFHDPDDDEDEQIGADVSQSCEVTWTVDKTANGWKGTVRVPLDTGRCLLVSRTDPTSGRRGEEAAAKKALSAAAKVLDSPAARALIPPQARFALDLVRNPKLQSTAKAILGKLF